ncbi:aminoglycoside phosphotransferase family protein [Ornithinibacillus xuwenensis]|uniref:Aminoglycoside phosphotransferase family protein n=1 Tax=Ornithinibacillus xuwenensis TaxID=3144668 RepID=A0ABU9XJB6_9BACI
MVNAKEWIVDEIEKSGRKINGHMEQIKTSDFCHIQKVPTSDGDLYFKATNAAASHEGALSAYLGRRYPGKTVNVMARDHSKGWFLMEDIGGEALRNIKDKQLWKRALQEYAELQVSELNHVEELLGIGVPDRRMSVLKEEIKQHLADMCKTGLSKAETEKVIELLPELVEMCDALDAILPASIEHGDLHTNNIRLVKDRIVFFDWGDASVSHPFFSTRIFWHALDDLIADESMWLGIVNDFRPYYLEPWTIYASMRELEKALQISDQLACVQRALSWHVYLTPSREHKAESYNRPSQWLQLLLEHRNLVGKHG